jgi:DNA-binding HxlR family transcriptional regulator
MKEGLQMSVSELPSLPGRASLPRLERTRARLEDFEMIERTRDALALLDPKWSVDIIFLLASGMRRHARLVDNIPGLSKKVLTSTLRKLERSGIVSRHVYADIPVRVEYTLTPLGWQLTEPLMVLYEWAVAHEDELASAKPPADDVQSTSRPALTIARAPAARAGPKPSRVSRRTRRPVLACGFSRRRRYGRNRRGRCATTRQSS